MLKKCITAFIMIMVTTTAFGQRFNSKNYTYSSKEWKRVVMHTPPSFFQTEEAKQIAENVLAFQRITGGWPKNVAMHRPFGGDLDKVLKDKQRKDDSTIDNDATILEMTYLARLYKQVPDERYKEAFLNGLEFMLSGQYDNGGWPQFWPDNCGYQVHITFNDDAMVQTLKVIRDLRDGVEPFSQLVDNETKSRLAVAFDKGIECILQTQIMTNGEPTVWCQQHNHITLEPAPARSYELPSYCSAESVPVVELLMEIPNPDQRIVAAVDGAMKWFDSHKIMNTRIERYINEDGERDVRVLNDKNADPVWARYYDLKTEKAFFCDRNGIPLETLAEVGYERRNGYSWYSQKPAMLYNKYEEWRKANRIAMK